MKKVLCFGEILWDILPNKEKKVGGAPMNVAYHLGKLGVCPSIISKIGTDNNGKELLNFLKTINLSSDLIQTDEHYKTSEVIATVLDNNEMSYDIVFPVAWDFIEFEARFKEILVNVDAFVFGSLSTRNNITKDTLYKMLEYSAYNVFDINLRYPYINKENIEYLLKKSDLVKLNESEINLLGKYYTLGVSENQIVNNLMRKFKIAEVIVTKGEKGGDYYNDKAQFSYKAVTVAVKDTIGSGDSFLAGFLNEKLKGTEITECLSFASKLASLITSYEGACPDYDIKELDTLKD